MSNDRVVLRQPVIMLMADSVISSFLVCLKLVLKGCSVHPLFSDESKLRLFFWLLLALARQRLMLGAFVLLNSASGICKTVVDLSPEKFNQS